MPRSVVSTNALLNRHIATERSRIATLKALGCANFAVATHFMKLVLLIAGLGALLGMGIGALPALTDAFQPCVEAHSFA